MTRWLLVGAGGFIGATLRYLVSGWAQRLADNPAFPYGTLSVNLMGCLVIGVLTGLAERFGVLTPESRAFLLIGILGSFTTFSTFAYETGGLLRDGQLGPALVNVGLHVVLGLLAVWLGWTLTQRV